MTKHTKGPWRVCVDDTGGQYSGWPSIAASEELDTTVIHRAGFHHEFWDWHPGLPEALANAHLIAAAPDLLEALEDARAQLEAYEEETGSGEYFNDTRINAAIAKAKGEANEQQR